FELDLDVAAPLAALLGDDLAQDRRDVDRLAAERKAAAEPAAGEVEHVVDQRRHACGAGPDQSQYRSGALVDPEALEDRNARVDRGERIAQVVAKDRDELLAQLGGAALAAEARLAEGDAGMGIDVKGDQLGEKPEHAEDPGVAELRRLGIEAAQ